MFLRKLFGMFALAAALFPAATFARDLDLAPSSRWVVNYAPDSCTLARSFGQGDEMILVQFVKYVGGAGFDFNVKGKPLVPWRREPLIGVRFGRTGDFTSKIPVVVLSDKPEEMIALRMGGRLDNYDFNRIRYYRLSRGEKSRFRFIDPAIENAVDAVSIRASGRTINLQTGSMRAPMASLNKCTTEMVASWGFDPKAMDDLALLPEPISHPADWLGELGDRYLRFKDQADISYRLDIDEKGVPTACTLHPSSGAKSIADAVCDQMKKRARFWPAETKDGTRVPAYYVGGVLYMW